MTMENTVDLSNLTELIEIVTDLVECKLSNSSKRALIKRLNTCALDLKISINKLVKLLDAKNSVKSNAAEFNTNVAEFNTIAKALNLPTDAPIVNNDIKNPNIEVPYEDQLPNAFINYVQSRINNDLKNVEVTSTNGKCEKSTKPKKSAKSRKNS